MLPFLSSTLAKLAAAVVAFYLLLSFLSAIRMYFIHGAYAHIEFNPRKWGAYGKWAPRRIRLLRTTRNVAYIVLVVWLIAVGFSIESGA